MRHDQPHVHCWRLRQFWSDFHQPRASRKRAWTERRPHRITKGHLDLATRRLRGDGQLGQGREEARALSHEES
jgi:hypothetical protein